MKKDKVDLTEKSKLGVPNNLTLFLEQEFGVAVTILPFFMFGWLFDIQYMGWLNVLVTFSVYIALMYYLLYKSALRLIEEREKKERLLHLEELELLNDAENQGNEEE